MAHSIDVREVSKNWQGKKEAEHGEPPSRLTIDVVREIEEFSALHDEWNAIVTASSATVFQTFEWMFLWWKHFGADPARALHLLLFRHDGRLVGVAPFFLETHTFAGVLLHRRLRLLGCGVVHDGASGLFTEYGSTDYLDIIGLPDYETSITHHLAVYLQRSSALYGEVEFVNVPQESLVVRTLVPQFDRQGVPYTLTRLDVCPRLNVPSSMEVYLRGRGSRVRHSLEQARKTFTDATVETIYSPEAVQGAFHDLVRLHQQRWNRLGYLGLFANSRFQRFQEEVARVFLERGWLWFQRVQMNGQTIAARLGFAFNGCFYDFLSGFDVDSPFAKRRPGHVLLLRMIEDAIKTQGRVVDLLRGNERYKFDLTPDFSYNWGVTVSNPATARSVRVRLYHALHACESLLRRVSKEGLILRVHAREHRFPAFVFRYLAFRTQRFFQNVTRERDTVPHPPTVPHLLTSPKQWVSQRIKNASHPLVKKIVNSLQRDHDLPLSRKLYKGFIFARAMFLAALYLRRCNTVGKRARTRGRPYIDNPGRIVVGDDFNLNSRIVRSELATGHKGVIEIGDEVIINFGASISAQKLVKIGNRVRVGPYAMIIDSDFHTPDERYTMPTGKPIIIEDEVWLAGRVTVLKGTKIGTGSVITAGSVVSGTIPPHVIAGGVPARVIRHLRKAEPPRAPRREPAPAPRSVPDPVTQRVTQVFSTIFSLNGSIDPLWGPKDIVQWDSLGHMNLIVGLETEFGISLTEDDLLNMHTVKDVCQIIKKSVEEE
ncbi:MAG: GNAT family N-acetyltransferase [Candidatus Latescibacteria bacterium]|nr:GNAT family N-acetyltransferase [Candidatus Latescibacterota bacterium]